MSTISHSPDLASRGVAFAPEIAGAASRHGVDPLLLAAVAAQETGGPGTNAGRNIVGDGGHGRGIFQIDDRFHAFARSAAAMVPAANADYAAGMIASLLQRYGGNVREALSAYNAGSPDAAGTVTAWGDGSRLGYADSVLKHYRALSGAPLPPNASASDRQTLLEFLAAEVQAEQEQLGALAQLALQAPAPSPAPDPAQAHSYRQLAGLDDNGKAQNPPDLASIVDADDAADSSNDPFDIFK